MLERWSGARSLSRLRKNCSDCEIENFRTLGPLFNGRVLAWTLAKTLHIFPLPEAWKIQSVRFDLGSLGLALWGRSINLSGQRYRRPRATTLPYHTATATFTHKSHHCHSSMSVNRHLSEAFGIFLDVGTELTVAEVAEVAEAADTTLREPAQCFFISVLTP